MGADRAILVRHDAEIEPLAVAKLLKAICAEEQPSLVILGKQAIDDDCNQVGQMLAALLGWSQGTFAAQLSIQPNTVTVSREVDGGLQTLELKLPAVITTDLRLNEPRYASLPNIMKARKKPILERKVSDFGIDASPRLKVLEVTAPEKRRSGVRVGSAAELVGKLRERGVL